MLGLLALNLEAISEQLDQACRTKPVLLWDLFTDLELDFIFVILLVLASQVLILSVKSFLLDCVVHFFNRTFPDVIGVVGNAILVIEPK